MPIRISQVDAFTARPFAGNPAAICVLDQLDDAAWMQAIAAEMQLSETAFLCGSGSEWQLRWFTPTTEVDLCGHATLAAAHRLRELGLAGDDPITFHTASGPLIANAGADGWIELDFPALPVEPMTPPGALLDALGLDNAVAVGRTRHDALVEVPCPEVVRELRPDPAALRRIPSIRGVIVTSVGDKLYDIVSRFFAPAAGIDEDPVTGSAHCALAPYWSTRLGKDQLFAHQASARGGDLRVTLRDDRVLLAGQAVTVLEGELTDACGP